MEVICSPIAAAPTMRRSSETGMATPSAFATSSTSRITILASWAVPGFSQIAFNVAPVSALIGLKTALPQSLTQISDLMSALTGAFNPAAASARLSARTRSDYLAVGLTEAEAITFDVLDMTQSNNFCRRIDNAANGPLRSNHCP